MQVEDNATPVIHPPRGVPVALQNKLKEELDRLARSRHHCPNRYTHPMGIQPCVCREAKRKDESMFGSKGSEQGTEKESLPNDDNQRHPLGPE